MPYRDRYGFHALASGGIGWGLPAAVGVALAQAPRPVCCFSGDGSAMYSIQALWTAAHLKLPITYVIANNGGYRIIKQRLQAFHGNDHFIGMDFADPKIDFTALAKSLGMPAERITEPARSAPPCSARSPRPARSCWTWSSTAASNTRIVLRAPSGLLDGNPRVEDTPSA